MTAAPASIARLRTPPLSPVEILLARKLHKAGRWPLVTASPDYRAALHRLAAKGLARVEDGTGLAEGFTFAKATAALNRLKVSEIGA